VKNRLDLRVRGCKNRINYRRHERDRPCGGRASERWVITSSVWRATHTLPFPESFGRSGERLFAEYGLFGWMAVTYFVLFAPHPPEARQSCSGS
jgi:hypothetical protein